MDIRIYYFIANFFDSTFGRLMYEYTGYIKSQKMDNSFIYSAFIKVKQWQKVDITNWFQLEWYEKS